MKEQSVVVFFFTNNNHISNVKTLQSIYKQDYSNINLIICNDCTYGFENERLLNNFQAQKGDNIRQIYFHENPYPIGEYQSILQFLHKIQGDFFLIIHSGEYFTSADILRKCIANMVYDAEIAVELVGAEQWTNDFAHRKIIETAAETALIRQISLADDIKWDGLRDCMVIYRLTSLRSNHFTVPDRCSHISRYIVPQFIEKEKVILSPLNLCRYSSESIQDVPKLVPSEYGNVRLENIKKLVQQQSGVLVQTETIFGSSLVHTGSHMTYKKNIILYRLSSYTRLKNYTLISLLLFVASALFMNISSPIFSFVGAVFIVLAFGFSLWTIGMLGCNLYFKKNPQRLVNLNGK